MKPSKTQLRHMRKNRIRSRVSGTSERPRLSVFRSLMHLSAQLIDDTAGRTILAVHTKKVKACGNISGAKKVGALLAEKAKEAKITAVVFDRNGYKYHGCLKALADAARAGGLQF